MTVIKGYVRYYQQAIPITWEKENDKYAYSVKKVLVKGDKLIVDKRLFDERVLKEEILSKPAFFKEEITDVSG